jgi:DNA-binding PadR family transcriptional regulator
MSRRSGILEFAILGLLRESPMHGYELRKRLNTSLGVFRAFSYGTLYPCLKTLVANGWLIEETGNTPEDALTATLAGRRAKIVYRLTAEGKEHFEELLSQTGPDAYEDEHFAARFAFFGHWRVAAAGWRSVWRRCVPPWRGPGSASTTTRLSCSATEWSPWSAKCAG